MQLCNKFVLLNNDNYLTFIAEYEDLDTCNGGAAHDGRD